MFPPVFLRRFFRPELIILVSISARYLALICRICWIAVRFNLFCIIIRYPLSPIHPLWPCSLLSYGMFLGKGTVIMSVFCVIFFTPLSPCHVVLCAWGGSVISALLGYVGSTVFISHSLSPPRTSSLLTQAARAKTGKSLFRIFFLQMWSTFFLQSQHISQFQDVYRSFYFTHFKNLFTISDPSGLAVHFFLKTAAIEMKSVILPMPS